MATTNIAQLQLPASLIRELESYHTGGHHPVDLGDLLESRYEVVHKLGSSVSGIVWLCLDTQTTKWRAIKVMTADLSANDGDEIYSYSLEHASPDELQRNHLVVPLDEFWFNGPNGRHRCLVLPVMGPTVKSWLNMLQGLKPTLTLPDAKFACYQIARAVQFLHSLGVCHGNINPAYIRVDLKGLEDFDKDEMLELLGEPEKYELLFDSGASPEPHIPKYIVSPPSGNWWEGLTTSSVRLTNFGQGFLAEFPPTTTISGSSSSSSTDSIDTTNNNKPLTAYAAPELVWATRSSPSPQSDIWSLAATIYELADGSAPLFNGTSPATLAQSIEHWLAGHAPDLKSRYATQGLTTSELDAFIPGPEYANRYEQALSREREVRPNSARRDLVAEDHRDVAVSFKLPRDEVVRLATLVDRMLRYEPGERLCIGDVLRDDWFEGCEKFLPRTAAAAAPANARVRGEEALDLGLAFTAAAAVVVGLQVWNST